MILKQLSFSVIASLAVGCSTLTESPASRKLTGERQWVQSTTKDDYLGPQKTQGMAPLIWKDWVIQGNGIDGIAAYDRKTGNLKWRTEIQNGMAGGAQIQDEKIFLGGSDGQFYALDASTGKVIWTFPTRAESLASPLVAQGKVFFLSGNNILYALDATTGKQIWIYNRPQATAISVRGGSTPTMLGETLYVGFSDGYVTAVNSKDGSLLWERQLSTNPRFRDVDGSPVLDGDFVFAASYDGALFCLSQKDGQIIWRVEEGGSTPVTIAGDTLFYASSSGKIMALQKKTGKPIWTRDLDQGVATQPIYFKNVLAIGKSTGNVEILNSTDGSVLYSYSPGWGVYARPTYDEGTGDLYVMSADANLHVIRLKWKQRKFDVPWQGIDL